MKCTFIFTIKATQRCSFFFSLALFFFDGFDVRRLRLRLRTFASILTHWKLFRIHQYRQWWRLYQKLCTFFFHLLFLFVISRSIWSQLKEREMSVLINIAWKSARKKKSKIQWKKTEYVLFSFTRQFNLASPVIQPLLSGWRFSLFLSGRVNIGARANLCKS